MLVTGGGCVTPVAVAKGVGVSVMVAIGVSDGPEVGVGEGVQLGGRLVGVAPRLVQGTWVFHRDHPLSDAAFRSDHERSGGLGAACNLILTNLAKWH